MTQGNAIQPSLAKLQALDSTTGTIAERLAAAAQIAGVSLLDSSGSQHVQRQFSHSRAEWVLRWLTENLRSKDLDTAKKYRLSPLTWILLSRLLDTVPELSIARLLNATNILHSIQTTLDEWVTALRTTPQQSKADTKNELNEKQQTAELSLSSRKRKRGSDTKASSISKTEALDSLSLESLYEIIGRFLRKIVVRSEKGGDDTAEISSEHMKSILRTDSKSATKILCSALMATIRMLQKGSEIPLDLFSSTIEIWKTRELERSDEVGASATVFSTECLVPACLLYGALLQHTSDSAQPEKPTTRTILDELDVLLHDHILWPAKLSYISFRTGKQSAPPLMIKSLLGLLKPLQEAIAFLSQMSEQNELLNLLTTVPRLYDLAIRRSRQTTSKQRSQETPWLEAVFEILSTCAGEIMSDDTSYPVSKQPPSSILRDFSSLDAMLTVARSRKVSLTQRLLGQILDRHSRLKHRPSPTQSSLHTVRWRLVKLVMDLDGDLFVQPEAERPVRMSQSTKKFNEEIFFQISSFNISSDQLGDSDSPTRYDTLDEFVSDIVVGLLRAFSASRELSSFLRSWHKELAKAATVLAPDELSNIPWTSSVLVQSAGAIIQNSLNTHEIEQIIKHQLLPPIQIMAAQFGISTDQEKLGVESSDPITDDPIANFYAAVVCLESTLSALSREDTINALSDSVNTIRVILQKIMIFDLEDFPLGTRIWRVLTRLQQLKRRTSAVGQNVNEKEITLEPPILDVAERTALKRSVSEENKAYGLHHDAFMFLITTGSELLKSASTVEHVNERIRICTQSYFSFYERVQERTESKAFCVSSFGRNISSDLALLSRFPFILRLIESERLRHIFQAFLCWPDPPEDLLICSRIVSLQDLDASLKLLQDTIVNRLDLPIQVSWISAILTTLNPNEQTQGYKVTERIRDRALNLLLDIPVDIMRRQDRENATEQLLPESQFHSEDECFKILSIMHKIERNSFAPSVLTIHPAKVWGLTKCVEAHASAKCLAVFGDLSQVLLRQVLLRSTQEQANKYFEDFDTTAEYMIISVQASNLANHAATLMLLENRFSISVDMNTSSELNGVTKMTSVPVSIKLRNAANSFVARGIRKAGKDASSSVTESQIDLQRSLVAIGCLLQTKGQQSAIVQAPSADSIKVQDLWIRQLSSGNNSQPPILTSPFISNIDRIFQHLLNNQTLSKEHTLQMLGCIIPHLSLNSLSLLLSSRLQQTIGSSTEDEIILRLLEVLGEGHTDSQTLTQSRRIKSLLISCLSGQSSSDSDRLQGKRILPILAKELQDANHEIVAGYALSDIACILRSKPFLVSQYGVESTVAALVNIATSRTHEFLRPHASQAFLRLCQITNSILSLHRKHLNGRMHILVPLLQILLNSLFSLHRNSNPTSSQKPPAWIPTRLSVLQGLHAVAFSRILLTLTQPTVSSTTTRHQSTTTHFLTDETRKARQYAAKFVPYIIAHFCSLHLVGRMSPEIRKAILPGIWACVETVPREGLRGMNASMSRDERAIWASLWAEWSRLH